MALSPSVMGIVNATPDSFFAGSRSVTTRDAIDRGRELFRAGCDVVDVGGESTRPGSLPVAADEELDRVIPVIDALSREGTVSVDTQKEVVARSAVAAGAAIVNDVSCSLIEVAGELGVGYVAMHRQGDSATMQVDPTYDDVVDDVIGFLRRAAERAVAAGVPRLWVDPGIGFGKRREHNLALVAHCARLVVVARDFGAGVLIGTSRKSFLADLGAQTLDVDHRLEGSIATEAWAMLAGVAMVRVHDADAAVQLRELLTRPLEGVGV